MPFVAIFTDAGKLVAFSQDRPLVRLVLSRLGDVLPPAKDDVEKVLRSARRKALRLLAIKLLGDK
jgi:hypothetical protein